MEWEVLVNIFRIFIYIIENILLIFIEIGNIGLGLGLREDRGWYVRGML